MISPQLLTELEQVLRRPKFSARLSDATIQAFIAGLAAISDIAADPPATAIRTRDPKDDYLVALAWRHTSTCSYPATKTSPTLKTRAFSFRLRATSWLTSAPHERAPARRTRARRPRHIPSHRRGLTRHRDAAGGRRSLRPTDDAVGLNTPELRPNGPKSAPPNVTHNITTSQHTYLQGERRHTAEPKSRLVSEGSGVRGVRVPSPASRNNLQTVMF